MLNFNNIKVITNSDHLINVFKCDVNGQNFFYIELNEDCNQNLEKIHKELLEIDKNHNLIDKNFNYFKSRLRFYHKNYNIYNTNKNLINTLPNIYIFTDRVQQIHTDLLIYYDNLENFDIFYGHNNLILNISKLDLINLKTSLEMSQQNLFKIKDINREILKNQAAFKYGSEIFHQWYFNKEKVLICKCYSNSYHLEPSNNWRYLQFKNSKYKFKILNETEVVIELLKL
jgi:hypothetical protein